MDAVDEVKNRLAIEDVVGEYVQLKRAGRNWRGLSPWTAEKTPSLIVSPDKQIWHDFSSGKGGNVFSFIMEMEGLDFKGALELLARKAGVDLEQYRTSSGKGINKERLYAANEAAAHFYQVQFSKNRRTLEYVLKERQFTKETALLWHLGYSPDGGTALKDFLLGKKFTETEIKRAGLTSSYGRDMFRGRLMIPLADPQGRIIGFTARILDNGEPKYINTPSTILYDKSRHVFGLHLAKEAIRQNDFVVLAEGNLDVIMSHQAGVKNVVAAAGTALTEQHLKILARFTSDISLAFDADKAGVSATERAIPIASRVGVSLSIINIPSGKDPDGLIKQDPKVWGEVISAPTYALDWLIERYQNLLDLASAQGKREFSDILLPVVSQLSDGVEQEHYVNQIAEVIGVSRETVEQKMTKASDGNTLRRRRAEPVNRAVDDKTIAERQKLEQHFMSIVMNRPEMAKIATLIHPDMLNPMSQNVWKAIGRPNFNAKAIEKSSVQNLAEYAKMLILEFEELYQGLEADELGYEVVRLQGRLVEQYVRAKKSEISAGLDEADDAEAKLLLTEAKKLDNLLKRAMEEVS